MINIQREYLLELCAALMDGHIKYGMGAKARSLNADPADIKAIDCSGFTRYLLYRATDGQVNMVDGSDEQNAWCKRRHLRSETYTHVAGLMDGHLRIAFIPRVYKDGKVARAGHVWLVMDGKTLESHGSKGPSRRIWNTPVLTARVKTCYVLAHLYSMTIGPITVTTV
jgi:hypothetical protein